MTRHGTGLLRQLLPGLVSLASICVLVGAWEVLPRIGVVRATLVPPFSETVVELTRVVGSSEFTHNLGVSASRWSIGLTGAVLIGTTLGIVMGRSRLAFRAIDPIVTLSYPVPKAAFILILVLFLGAGQTSMVTVIILGTSIPMIISSYHGAKGIEPRLLWAASALGTKRVESVVKVVLPAALPSVLSGLRISLVVSLFTLLGSELLIRQSGIGGALFTNWDNGQYSVVWAYTMAIALFGFLLDVVYVAGVRRLCPWLEGDV
jgi:ABC-type nitrate/sulfonate/bicarbonate transport system permease component